jgi:hypothetical protein
MRLLRHPLAALVLICCVLGACGSDKPKLSVPDITTASSSSSDADTTSSGGETTQPSQGGGNLDCAALKTDLADILVNWQLVIGLSNTPASEWTNIPLGSLPKFGDQLAAVKAALSSDADAVAALSYMSGANDIVARGLGGDSAAQTDLAAYMGTDVAANVGKQLPISIAFQNAGCS